MTMKDTEVYEILQAEETRQKSILRMIPSECIMSDDVLACLVISKNKFSNRNINIIERTLFLNN